MQTQRNIYIQRINMVIDHITSHIQDEHSLASLAAIAGFSDYHFHRVFKVVVGETLSQFVWRVRLDRAAIMMRTDSSRAITDIAESVGFTSIAGFSRAFKRQFTVTPSRWQQQSHPDNIPTHDALSYHVHDLAQCANSYPVYFQKMDAQKLAYIRVYDSYSDMGRIQNAYDILLNWYQEKGASLYETTLYGMSLDDPHITPKSHCRFDWCLRVPDDWCADEVVNMMDFPACLLAVCDLRGDVYEEERILDYMWCDWLPRSAYQPANLPAMEIYNHLPKSISMTTHYDMRCAIPIVRL
ncbi:MAG: AraC family transcriptional regulator [Chloroflexota bacterium]